jgi:hypothetical protein
MESEYQKSVQGRFIKTAANGLTEYNSYLLDIRRKTFANRGVKIKVD